MKIQLLVLTLLLPFTLKAQDCLTQKDKITGLQIKSGTVILESDSSLNSVQFIVLKNENDLSFGISLISTLPASSFEAGTMKLSIKFENGQVKTFNPSNSTKVGRIANRTVVGFKSSVTADDLEYLHMNSVSQFVFSYNGEGDSNFLIPVSELNAAKIRNSLICISN